MALLVAVGVCLVHERLCSQGSITIPIVGHFSMRILEIPCSVRCFILLNDAYKPESAVLWLLLPVRTCSALCAWHGGGGFVLHEFVPSCATGLQCENSVEWGCRPEVGGEGEESPGRHGAAINSSSSSHNKINKNNKE